MLSTGHIGLNVTDLDRSVTFYEMALGLTMLGRSSDPQRRYAFLGLAGKTMVTLWQQSEGEFQGDRPGLHHLSFEVPDVDAVLGVEARLRALGTAIRRDATVGEDPAVSGQIFFADPDGLRLEIYALDRPAQAVSAAGAPACGFF